MTYMTRHLLPIWILLAVLLLSACADDRRTVSLLERAETCLPSCPDSAQMYLDSISNPKEIPVPNQAHFALLRTITDELQDKKMEDDSLIRIAYDFYYQEYKSASHADKDLLRHYAQSCYYLGLYYQACDSTKQCEDLFRKAIQCSQRCKDWHTCYIAYIRLCNTTMWSNPEHATQQALNALDTYKKINDNVNNLILILGRIASCYLCIDQPEKAIQYYRQAYELAEKNQLTESMNEMCMGIAGAYLYIEDNEKALEYAKKGIRTAHGEVLITSQRMLAECYYVNDSIDTAKKLLKSIQCDSTQYIAKYLILRSLSEIAIRQKDIDSLSIYMDSAYECMEDRFFHAQHVKDEYYQANLTKEIEKEAMRHEATLHRWIWALSTILLLLIALFIIYNVIRHKKRVIKEHRQEIQHQQEIIHQKSLTLSILQKHLMVQLENARLLLSDSEKIKMTEEAWAEIEHLINNTDNNFVENLRRQHTDFKEADIQLCMLIRMKVTNATIAKIFYISESAVKKRKSTLKKNGFKVIDPNIFIEQIIESL